MENSRAPESRKSQTHNNVAAGRERTQPPTDFEGMNYEQKRKPYRDLRSAEANRNEAPGSSDRSGENRDDQ